MTIVFDVLRQATDSKVSEAHVTVAAMRLHQEYFEELQEQLEGEVADIEELTDALNAECQLEMDRIGSA